MNQGEITKKITRGLGFCQGLARVRGVLIWKGMVYMNISDMLFDAKALYNFVKTGEILEQDKQVDR